MTGHPVEIIQDEFFKVYLSSEENRPKVQIQDKEDLFPSPYLFHPFLGDAHNQNGRNIGSKIFGAAR